MTTLRESVAEFLATDGIAVVGVSRDPRQAANLIYRKLRDSGRRVFAVNPRAAEVEGNPCYSDLAAVPGGARAAVIVTPPGSTAAVVRQCHELGIGRVWIHGSMGSRSVPREAVELCRRHGIRVIAGACPMMFCEPVDVAHGCMRTVLGWLRRLPPGE
jgi:hypothetical protein